jgi:hypothetical protein
VSRQLHYQPQQLNPLAVQELGCQQLNPLQVVGCCQLVDWQSALLLPVFAVAEQMHLQADMW